MDIRERYSNGRRASLGSTLRDPYVRSLYVMEVQSMVSETEGLFTCLVRDLSRCRRASCHFCLGNQFDQFLLQKVVSAFRTSKRSKSSQTNSRAASRNWSATSSSKRTFPTESCSAR